MMLHKVTACLPVLLLLSNVSAFVPQVTVTKSSMPLSALSFNDVSSKSDVLAKSTLPGNFGFDPLQLAKTSEQLTTYRKAELKHGRLAILVS